MQTKSERSERPSDLERLGRYKIVRPLSKGGMALVYEARRESLAGVSPRVAIKLILPEHESSETFRDLFINEARLGASMHHQNLVQIQDFDCDADRYYLVMEYVEGLTLRRIISLCQRHGLKMPVGVIAELGRQACDGLHYAHCASDEQGRHLRLVHRDIKPSNLILSPHGVVKVLDFGISKGRLRVERQGSVKGTWGYMAPEQAAGEEVQPGADVFGLATCLYELASLRPMFQDKTKDEIKRLLRDDHAARMAATLDVNYAPLIPVLVRALQRDPKARFGTAEELGRALSSLLPDPITSRDEVTRFYAMVDALEAGRPPPAVTHNPHTAGSQASLRPLPETRGGAVRGWLVGTLAATGLAAVLLLVVLGVGALLLRQAPVRIPSPVIVEGTELSLQDLVAEEPAGPAGEGAPGEAIERTAGDRRAPRAAPSVGGQRGSEVGGQAAGDVEATTPAPEVVRVRIVRRAEDPGTDEEVSTHAPVEVGARSAGVATSSADLPSPLPDDIPPDADTGVLVVDAKQEAEIYIGGQFVDYAPVRRDLPAGRYSVSVVALDGRRRSFEVEIEAGKRIRRTWDFDRMEWR